MSRHVGDGAWADPADIDDADPFGPGCDDEPELADDEAACVIEDAFAAVLATLNEERQS